MSKHLPTTIVILISVVSVSALAQPSSVLYLRGQVGGFSAPEIKVTTVSVAARRLQPQECFDLAQAVQSRLTEVPGVQRGCSDSVPEEFASALQGRFLQSSHLVSYSDSTAPKLFGTFYAIYHQPSAKYTCEYILRRFHKDHQNAKCLPSR